MSQEPSLRVDAEARLHRCLDVAAGIRWPFPLEARLDQLIELADNSGENTNKTELVAAFVYGSPSDVAGLVAVLHSYRIATAGDALLSPPAENVVEFTRRPPGPRRKKSMGLAEAT
jgi:hypothetical protein